MLNIFMIYKLTALLESLDCSKLTSLLEYLALAKFSYDKLCNSILRNLFHNKANYSIQFSSLCTHMTLQVWGVAVNMDNSKIASVSDDNSVIIYNCPT